MARDVVFWDNETLSKPFLPGHHVLSAIDHDVLAATRFFKSCHIRAGVAAHPYFF